MNRAELEHIIRAASGITGDADIVPESRNKSPSLNPLCARLLAQRNSYRLAGAAW
jgi:hypothetical protein